MHSKQAIWLVTDNARMPSAAGNPLEFIWWFSKFSHDETTWLQSFDDDVSDAS